MFDLYTNETSLFLEKYIKTVQTEELIIKLINNILNDYKFSKKEINNIKVVKTDATRGLLTCNYNTNELYINMNYLNNFSKENNEKTIIINWLNLYNEAIYELSIIKYNLQIKKLENIDSYSEQSIKMNLLKLYKQIDKTYQTELFDKTIKSHAILTTYDLIKRIYKDLYSKLNKDSSFIPHENTIYPYVYEEEIKKYYKKNEQLSVFRDIINEYKSLFYEKYILSKYDKYESTIISLIDETIFTIEEKNNIINNIRFKKIKKQIKKLDGKIDNENTRLIFGLPIENLRYTALKSR